MWDEAGFALGGDAGKTKEKGDVGTCDRWTLGVKHLLGHQELMAGHKHDDHLATYPPCEPKGDAKDGDGSGKKKGKSSKSPVEGASHLVGAAITERLPEKSPTGKAYRAVDLPDSAWTAVFLDAYAVSWFDKWRLAVEKFADWPDYAGEFFDFGAASIKGSKDDNGKDAGNGGSSSFEGRSFAYEDRFQDPFSFLSRSPVVWR